MGDRTTVQRKRRPGRSVAALACAALVALGGALAGTAGSAGATTSPAPHGLASPVYQLSLGDSLAYGIGASAPALDYVSLVAAHAATAYPGLQVENLSCPGATTTSMINGQAGCAPPTDTQLAAAESFLSSHVGQVPFITIDIGANNVDGCLTGGSTINVPCIVSGLGAIGTDLPKILAGLHAAAPGVPIFGMDYYNPFLALWVLGGAGGPALATQSATLSTILNGSLVQEYGAGGAIPVDVQGPFATQDFALTGSFQGTVVPENVSRTCAWTHMCDASGLTIHTNDIGHAVLARAFEQAIDRHIRGGGLGAWLADAAGGVHTTGNATGFGSQAGRTLARPVVGMVATPDGGGYWLVAGDGGVFAFGDAGFFGSMGGTALTRPIVGMAATSDGRGYWLVASDGGVFAFGDAGFFGSMGGKPLNRPVVGIAQSGSDHGYWLVASDGGVFNFGDAVFHGSTGATPLAAPVVAVAATVDGNGYWLVAGDGGVFAFGDALFHGSTGGTHLAAPVTAVAPPPDGYGYTLAAADGGAFAFGSAVFTGSLAGSPPAAPVVALAST